MEVEDFYTGEKKEIVIPEGCIMIDEEKLSYGHYALIDDDEDVEGQNAEIIVDFFPNNPKRFSEIPLYKSSKEGQFSVVVIKDKYYKWVDLKKRQKQNELKREQNIDKQWEIYNKICDLRGEGEMYRQKSQFESAIASYNLSLQVDYKSVNKWFKSDCIGQSLLSYNGLIAVYHKLNDLEKERECLERAISLASLDSRFKKDISLYKRKLGKLLGTYKEKEVPPKSHMNVVYTDLINDCDVYKKTSQPLVIKNGTVVNDEKNLKHRKKLLKYFHDLVRQGQAADKEFDYKTATDIYERLIAEDYFGLYWTSLYDRLIAIYFNYKLYEDEVRIIKLAIKTFKEFNDNSIEALSHQYDKRIEQLEKRLISAQKRLQSFKKEGK